MKHVVITGVSSGIGQATTAELVAHGYHVLGSVRRPDDARPLQERFGDHFTALTFDVTDQEAVRRSAEAAGALLGERSLAGLVNNAGIAVPGPLMYLSLDDYRHQFEVNVLGVIAVTQAFLPLLGARDAAPAPGRIINISSVSGQLALPFFSPYAASKHALEAISHSLRRELMLYGIDVIIVGPGSVRTPIWDKAAQIDTSPFEDTVYGPFLRRAQQMAVSHGRNSMPVDRVARVIRQALESPRPRVRYAVVNSWLSNWLLTRVLPARWVDRIAGGRMGLR